MLVFLVSEFAGVSVIECTRACLAYYNRTSASQKWQRTKRTRARGARIPTLRGPHIRNVHT